MKKVWIYGAYDADNLGDDYMMYQIDKKLKTSNIKPIYKSYSKRKNYFNMKIDETYEFPKSNNKLFLLFNTLKWIFNSKDIENVKALIFMGGGYTNEEFGLKNLLIIYFLILKFKLNNKKIYFTGQTVGPVNKKIYKFLIKRIYKCANKIYVREEFSKAFLDSLKIDSELIGDDAFLTYNNLNFDIDLIEKKGKVIFNYKEFSSYDLYKKQYFEFLLNFAKDINSKILVIPFRSEKTSKEYLVNYELYEYLKENGIDTEFIVERDIEKFQKIFSSSKYVIGTAYHSIVLGLIFNNIVYSSFLGNYYKIKIEGILNWYKLSGKNSINMEDIKSFDIVNSINKQDLCSQKIITTEISDKVNKAWDKMIEEIIK